MTVERTNLTKINPFFRIKVNIFNEPKSNRDLINQNLIIHKIINLFNTKL